MFSWLLSVGGVDSLLFGSDSGSEKILQNFFKDKFFLSTEERTRAFHFRKFFILKTELTLNASF